MTQPFLGEIRPFGFNFAPKFWAFCNGQIIAISSNTALFSLLGTTYGGNGVSTFGLPDLQGRTPMHRGLGGGLTDRVLGETSGEETVTLTTSTMPAHSHTYRADTTNGNQRDPRGNGWGAAPSGAERFSPTPDGSTMAPGALTTTGGGGPHENRSPYLAITFCIAMSGIFPARN